MKNKLLLGFLCSLALLCPAISQAQTYDAVSGLYYRDNGDGTATIVNNGSYGNYFSGAANIPVTIGNLSVTGIDAYAFFGCSGLKSVTIPDSVTTMGNAVFSLCTSLTNANLGNGIPTIGYQTFYNCFSLANVTIGNNVTDIGLQSFFSCTNILNLTLPASLTTIEGGAFGYCYGLTNIIVPSNVNRVDDGAFQGCRMPVAYFTGNAPPDNGGAFRYCYATTVYYQPGDSTWGTSFGGVPTAPYAGAITVTITPPNIGAKWGITGGALTNNSGDVITGLAVTNYTISFSIVNGYFPPAGQRMAVTFNTTNTFNAVYTTNSFAFTTNNGTITITGYNGAPPADLTIPRIINGRKVTAIADEAFYNFTTLTNVTISPNVTSIGESAFDTCTSLISVTIPSSVTSMGGATFASCRSLKSITLPNSLNVIPDSAFVYCSGLTNVVIPDGIIAIQNNAFSYCTSLMSVTIPGSVTSIGIVAFYGCSSLTAAYFIGNAPPDNNTTFQSTPATVYYQPGASGWYSTFGSAPTAALIYAGAVTATIVPNNIGAKWAIDGGSFTNNSGDLIIGLAVTNHTITFSPVGGYATPAAQTFSLPINTTNAISAIYAPVRIAHYTLANGIVTLDLNGPVRGSTQIQVSTDLIHWKTLATTNAPANGAFQFIDANPPQPAAYYRLSWNAN